MTWVTLNTRSGNLKTGPIVVSTTETGSCPKECAISQECYAKFSFLGGHWKKIGKIVKGKRVGDNWDAFCDRLSKIKGRKLFRHNQAGDLPKLAGPYTIDRIDTSKLRKLTNAAKKLIGFTYSHYDVSDKHNADAIKESNNNGFVINLSANNLTEADEYVKLNIGPVVTILSSDAPNMGNKTPLGVPIVVCPAQTQDDITCETCKLCAVGNRKSIVGFKSHGVAKKRLSLKTASYT